MTNAGPGSGIDRANIETLLPLSPMQQGLLFHSLLAPASGAYVPQLVLTLRGDIDSQAMRTAWQRALDRHGALRGGFYWKQRDEPFQLVQRRLDLPWTEVDWRALDAPAQSARLLALKAANRGEPFDLARPPLMRLHWIRIADDRWHMLWCYHHLLLDGWSAALLLNEVMRDCAGQTPAPPPPPYAHYIAWLQQRDREAALAFWRDELTPLPPAVELPCIRQGALTSGASRPLHVEHRLSPDAARAVQQFARDHGLTLATLMQGALGLLLRRYGHDGDALIGTTVSGRPADLPQALHMIGLFINTVPVRLRMRPRQTVLDALRDLQATRARAADHEHLSLRDIQAACSEGRALFDCLLVIESYPTGSAQGGTSGPAGLALEGLDIDESTHFPLTLQVAEGDTLTLAARADARRSEATELAALLAHWAALLQSMCAQPQAALGDIALADPALRAERMRWNDTAADFPAHCSPADLFERTAAAHPERIALRCAGIGDAAGMSYRELNARANRVAHALIAQGVGPEQVVALAIERSFELMVALIAVAKTGAIWLPLDSANPPARLAGMLDDARPATVLCAGDAPDWLPGGHPTQSLASLMHDGGDANPARRNLPASAAYLLYTSGSTGRPKGVLNTQAGIVNRLHWMQRHLQLTADDRVLQKTPLGFDVSVWELFWPLIEGATLVIAPPAAHTDRAAVAGLIEREAVSVLHFVPSMLADFLDQPALATRCAALRDVVCSGEALASPLARRFAEALPHARLHNLYGPTEAAIDVSFELTRADCDLPTIPIGAPIDNIRLHIVDADGMEVPAGGRGRLYIGGTGPARGYLKRADLTAERFLPDHLSGQGGVLYDSGDRARRLADGRIEYLGRADQQFKLRGVRMEAGEIEAALCALPGVRQALVKLWPDLPGGAALAAYLVADGGAAARGDSVTSTTWATTLRSRLPDAMQPAHWIVLDALPLTPNGKPDRNALPRPQTRSERHVEARNATEQTLAGIWQTVLKLDAPPGVHDSFFALGGHSLIATRIVARIGPAFGLDLPLRDVFEHPTLEALAARIDALRAPAGGKRREVEL
ncbi:non-ribosomal peptide synthetase [Methyloversatilis thermotolerans]|uniref:non-ribosomal peptide synthetase n=1 Tax=Methyloversatilis thermotolerans TaxID=1346290 RepID=UPI00036371C2|nr:non-ribosomal peptide synthetase [Methyloversatilis thermotolerans]